MKKLIKIYFLTFLFSYFFIFLLFYFLTSTAQAQNIGITDPDRLGQTAKTSGYLTESVQDIFLPDSIVAQVIVWLLGFVGVIFLALVIFSGFQWMTAGGNEEKVTSAKKRIIAGAGGLTLIFFSFIIASLVFRFFYEQTNRAEPEDAYEQNGISCEKNSDCPATQPICKQTGIWKFCSCNSNNDCSGLSTPHCRQRTLQGDICSECTQNDHCNDGQICDDGECIIGN